MEKFSCSKIFKATEYGTCDRLNVSDNSCTVLRGKTAKPFSICFKVIIGSLSLVAKSLNCFR